MKQTKYVQLQHVLDLQYVKTLQGHINENEQNMSRDIKDYAEQNRHKCLGIDKNNLFLNSEAEPIINITNDAELFFSFYQVLQRYLQFDENPCFSHVIRTQKAHTFIYRRLHHSTNTHAVPWPSVYLNLYNERQVLYIILHNVTTMED